MLHPRTMIAPVLLLELLLNLLPLPALLLGTTALHPHLPTPPRLQPQPLLHRNQASSPSPQQQQAVLPHRQPPLLLQPLPPNLALKRRPAPPPQLRPPQAVARPATPAKSKAHSSAARTASPTASATSAPPSCSPSRPARSAPTARSSGGLRRTTPLPAASPAPSKARSSAVPTANFSVFATLVPPSCVPSRMGLRALMAPSRGSGVWRGGRYIGIGMVCIMLRMFEGVLWNDGMDVVC